jgi:hypothetical protein
VLAGVGWAHGQLERAARMLGHVEVVFTSIGSRMKADDRRESDRLISATHTQLVEAAWAKARAEGQTMSMEEAVAYALEEASHE